jgi:hypothetical protein
VQAFRDAGHEKLAWLTGLAQACLVEPVGPKVAAWQYAPVVQGHLHDPRRDDDRVPGFLLKEAVHQDFAYGEAALVETRTTVPPAPFFIQGLGGDRRKEAVVYAKARVEARNPGKRRRDLIRTFSDHQEDTGSLGNLQAKRASGVGTYRTHVVEVAIEGSHADVAKWPELGP